MNTSKNTAVVLSIITAMAINSFANENTSEMEELKQRITKLEKQLKKVSKQASDAKIQSAGDNLKWDVDFRTQIDNIEYKHASGKTSKNDSLMTNRLLLGTKYQADENSIFYGTLSYMKAYGDTANHSQSNTQPGFANFDWVTSENAIDNTVKVKEAYWLYSNDTFLGTDTKWSASIGRRPSTDGLGINLRADQQRKSALSHTVNVEFDGASFKFDLEKATSLEGSWIKFCMGRGLTNAKQRFQMDGTDYAKDSNLNDNIDMAGFILVPYDNGQYSLHMNYARAYNLIGYTNAQIGAYQTAMQTAATPSAMMDAQANLQFNDVGNMDLFTSMLKVDGIGNEINDYLDNTTLFVSYAQSKTLPNGSGDGMLGTKEEKVGQSVWIGLNAPCPLSPDDAKIGIEWNKGSQYWRSMTYAEDTLAGSKISTRGTAFEIYRTQKLTKALSFGVSYVKMKYNYTGSNAFFGSEGTPMTIAQAKANGQDPVESAQDIKAYITYRF